MAFSIDKRTNHVLILSLGGNIGDVEASFNDAIAELEQSVGNVEKKSSIYKTAAWGVENQPDFINQVLLLNTILEPLDCLHYILNIEQKLGRVRNGEKWQQRPIDIDILFYDQEVIDLPDLKVPHPYLHKRNFILYPLAEISPKFVHPQLNMDILALKNRCIDELKVDKV